MKIKTLNRQKLPESVEKYMQKQTACITEMRSPEYHNNCGLLYECRQRVQGVYDEAMKIDIEALLNSPAENQSQYDLLMNTCRKMTAILDAPDLYRDEASQERALR